MTVDVARVVAGLGHLDKVSVYVPMTRGRDGNFLYITENQPGDTETGHGRTVAVERRESEDYARDVLIAAAQREQGDHTPQAVFGQARNNYYLTRWLNSPSTQIKETPFIDGPMADYMARFNAQRENRFAQYHDTSQKHATVQPPQSERTQNHQRQRAQIREKIQAGLSKAQQNKARCEEELNRIREELAPLRAQREDVDSKITNAQGLLHQTESEVQRVTIQRNSRGVVGRWWNKNTDKHIADNAVAKRNHVYKQLQALQQRRLAIAEPIEKLERQEHQLRRTHGKLVREIQGYEASTAIASEDSVDLMVRIAQRQAISRNRKPSTLPPPRNNTQQYQRLLEQSNPDTGMEPNHQGI